MQEEISRWWWKRCLIYNIFSIIWTILFFMLNLLIIEYFSGPGLFFELNVTPVLIFSIFIIILNLIYWLKGKKLTDLQNAQNQFRTLLNETALVCTILVLVPFLPAYCWVFATVPSSHWGYGHNVR